MDYLVDDGSMSNPPILVEPTVFTRILGEKEYEMKDHLGNVRVVISDLKAAPSGGRGPWEADILSWNNYYPFGMAQPDRHGNTEKYRYGFNGKEMDNEVKENPTTGTSGVGNSYDYGARGYDPRSGRWWSVDPLFKKYPSISSYAYVANNPIFYVDPDGRIIKLAAGLTNKQKLQIISNLQKLTNDRLVYKTLKDSTTQIKIVSLAKSGTETKVAGTRLIRRLNSSNKTMTINIGAPGSGNYEMDVNPADAISGKGSDVNVSFDPTSNPSIATEDPVTGRVSGKSRPNEIGLAHELIHGERSMRGEAINYSDMGTHTYIDASGNTITQTVPKEELATVGLKYNKKDDVTENDIRKEQGQNKRGAY
ncbi:MAG: hypothetical protein J4G05_09010 [Chlorobi bacterium]|nr:hypothetical protein [Chlorobiota bacterium]